MIAEETQQLVEQLEIDKSIYCRMKHIDTGKVICHYTERGKTTESELRQRINYSLQCGYKVETMEEEVVDLYHPLNFVLLLECVLKSVARQNLEVALQGDPRACLINSMLDRGGLYPEHFTSIKAQCQGQKWYTELDSKLIL